MEDFCLYGLSLSLDSAHFKAEEQPQTIQCTLFISSWGDCAPRCWLLTHQPLQTVVTWVSLSARQRINCLIYTLRGWQSLRPNCSTVRYKQITLVSRLAFQTGSDPLKQSDCDERCSTPEHPGALISRQSPHLLAPPSATSHHSHTSVCVCV